MPIYEYRCTACENEFEVFVQSANSEVKCVECGDANLQRKFSVFGMKSGSKFRSSSSKGSCGSCSTHNCSSCNCSCG